MMNREMRGCDVVGQSERVARGSLDWWQPETKKTRPDGAIDDRIAIEPSVAVDNRFLSMLE